jgi:hypothetical protein
MPRILAAPSDHSLFRRSIRCSGNENSLFRQGRESVRKPFGLQHDPVPAIAETGRNRQNSLLISLFAGKAWASARRDHGVVRDGGSVTFTYR